VLFPEPEGERDVDIKLAPTTLLTLSPVGAPGKTTAALVVIELENAVVNSCTSELVDKTLTFA
jgi:hypothetical protein